MHEYLVEKWLTEQKRDATPEIAEFIDDFLCMMEQAYFEADCQE